MSLTVTPSRTGIMVRVEWIDAAGGPRGGQGAQYSPREQRPHRIFRARGATVSDMPGYRDLYPALKPLFPWQVTSGIRLRRAALDSPDQGHRTARSGIGSPRRR